MKNPIKKTRVTLSLREISLLKRMVITYELRHEETDESAHLYNKLFDAEARIQGWK